MPSSTSPRTAMSLALMSVLALASGQGEAAEVDPDGNLNHMRPLLEQTLETEKSGIEIRWSNPSTGDTGKIRVVRTFFKDERPCREYIRTVSRSRQSGFIIRGTACRTGRAVWSIQDEVATETDRPSTTQARVAPTTPRGSDRAAERSARSPEAQPAPARRTREEPTTTQPVAPERASKAPSAPATATAPEAPSGADPDATAAAPPEPAAGPEPEPFVTFTLPSRSPI